MTNDVYSLKEMVQEVRNDSKTALVNQTRMSESLTSILDHLEKLNSKVATHEKQLNTFSVFKAQAMLVWGAVILAIDHFILK